MELWDYADIFDEMIMRHNRGQYFSNFDTQIGYIR